MVWMRAVCRRLKSDYRYSKDVVYNNFLWPTPTDEQKDKIEWPTQAIFDACVFYSDSSLADLYDETTMPPQTVQDPPAEQQGCDASLRLLRQRHDREQMRG